MKSKHTDFKFVQECLHQIEVKLGWGDSSQWHNDMFIELSEIIQKETKTLLSTTTLKRVWGKVNYNSAPSISTLNTLAQFAGYTNWREYKNKTQIKKRSWIEKNIHPNLGIIIPTAAALTIVFIILFSLTINNKNINTLDVSKIQFRNNKITEDVPNSVVFDFDLNNVSSDSIYIQQFWDKTKTIKLNTGQKQATGIYYYPGYFRAKLLVDGTIVKENDLFIKSNGWLATIDYKPIPKYLKNLKQLSLPLNLVNEISKNDEPLTSTFHYINDFDEVSGDNFRLNTNIQNIYNDKWAVCQNVTIIIVGTKSALMIPFSISGCSSNLRVMMSETFLSGKEHDLSSLTLDLSKATDLKIEVINKRLTVYNENLKLFSNSYNESIGRIVGLRYRFLGAGQVHNISLTNLSESMMIINHPKLDLH